MKKSLLVLIFALSAVSGLTATTVYTTDFTGTNGTTPNGWSTVTGLTISSNNYVADGASNAGSIYNDGLGASGIAGLGAYEVTSSFQTTNTTNGKIVGLVAFSDASVLNYYLGRVRSTATSNVWAFEIYKFVGGTGSLLATGASTIALGSNTSFQLRFAVDSVADTQTFSVFSTSGTVLLGSVAATDSTFSAGLAGLRVTDGTAVITYQDFAITTSTIPEPATTALLGGLGVLGMAVLGCRRRRARGGK